MYLFFCTQFQRATTKVSLEKKEINSGGGVKTFFMSGDFSYYNYKLNLLKCQGWLFFCSIIFSAPIESIILCSRFLHSNRVTYFFSFP